MLRLFRPSNGTWYVCGVETVAYVASTDVPA